MDLRQLAYVVAVAEELSFTRAAARLHMTQPPLTMQIRTIEAELGYPLFKRTKRSVQVTDAGRVLAEGARRILRDVADLREKSARASRGDAGRVVIGFIDAVALDFFPQLLRQYRAAFPDVEIELHEKNNRALMEELRSKRVDVAFLRPYFQDADIETHVLFSDRFVVAVPVGHRLANHDEVRMADLAEEPFVTVNRSPSPSVYAQVMALCENAGFHPRIAQESTNLPTAVALVSAGLGVTILPGTIARLALNGVVYRRLANVKEHPQLAVAWRKDNAAAVLDRFLALSRRFARGFARNDRKSG